MNEHPSNNGAPRNADQREKIYRPLPDLPTSKGEQLKLMVQIAAGLLSSGKYHEEDSGEYITPQLLSYDRSRDYEAEEFFLRKHPLVVSNDAAHLLDDLWLEVLEYNGVQREIDMRAMVEAGLEERQ
jgi:hypothetical protein